MGDNILLAIEQNLSGLSKGQRRIANFITEHYQDAAFMTAAGLGAAVSVSESTVVRFAAQIGFDGYPALQRALQEMIRSKLTSVQRIAVTARQLENENILNKVLSLDIEKIKRTVEETSSEVFDRAVEAIVGAGTIYVIASRSALPLAQFLNYYLRLIFQSVRLVDAKSSSETFEQLMHFKKDDVLIGISFPRYSKNTVKAFRYVSDKGGQAVAITDSDSSPLAPVASHLLLARSDMISFIDSLVAPLSLINALIVALGQKKQDTLIENFRELERIWDEYDVYTKLYDGQ